MLTAELLPLETIERGEVLLETGRSYDGVTPVVVHVTKRGRRLAFSDGGGAVTASTVDPSRLLFPGEVVMGRFAANVNGRGVVWIPASLRSSPEWLSLLPDLVADASVRLYEALLAQA